MSELQLPKYKARWQLIATLDLHKVIAADPVIMLDYIGDQASYDSKTTLSVRFLSPIVCVYDNTNRQLLRTTLKASLDSSQLVPDFFGSIVNAPYVDRSNINNYQRVSFDPSILLNADLTDLELPAGRYTTLSFDELALLAEYQIDKMYVYLFYLERLKNS